MTTSDKKDWIHCYRSQGLNILPAHYKKKAPDGFEPPINWTDYQNAFVDDKQIKTWIMENKFQNIFAILGKISNDIIEIDVDVPDINITDIFKEPETAKRKVWIAESSQGKKKIYARATTIGQKQDEQVSNQEYIKTDGKKAYPHVEYRPDGHGSILPPSIHPDGTKYKWLNLDENGNLLDLQKIDTEKLYNTVVDRLRKKYDYKPDSNSTVKHFDNQDVKQFANQDKEKLRHCFYESFAQGDRWSESSGHEFRTAVACEAINAGFTDNEIHQIFKTHDESSGEPYNYETTQYQIKQLRRKQLNRWSCSTLQEKCPDIIMQYCNHCTKYLSKKHGIYIYKKIQDKDTGETYTKKTGVKHTNLADLIDQEYGYHFHTLKDTEEIIRFNNGIYTTDGSQVIRQIAEKYAGRLSKKHLKNEIVDHIKDKRYIDRDVFFKTDQRYINFINGIYDIETKKFIEHSPDYHFLSKIPVKYNPNATCPQFKKFLQDICMQNKKRRIEIEDTIQEYMGYTLYRSYPYKRYIVLDGSGDNGKTVLLNVVEAMVGPENNAGVPLQDLEERPFALSKLYGKHANISDDLPNKPLRYCGIIKQITGNSPLWADVKNHKEGIRFTNYAKPWNACNQLPETYDITDAFMSRMLQITLLNKYVKSSDSYLINDVNVFHADKKLLNKLMKELPGIINFSLQGLHRLFDNDGFSFQQSTDDIRTEYIKKTNPVHAFLEDECAQTNDDWGILKDDLYNEIICYCERQGYDKPTSQQMVTSKLNSEPGNIRLTQKRINGERQRVWLGVQSLTNGAINQYFGKNKENNEKEVFF